VVVYFIGKKAIQKVTQEAETNEMNTETESSTEPLISDSTQEKITVN